MVMQIEAESTKSAAQYFLFDQQLVILNLPVTRTVKPKSRDRETDRQGWLTLQLGMFIFHYCVLILHVNLIDLIACCSYRNCVSCSAVGTNDSSDPLVFCESKYIWVQTRKGKRNTYAKWAFRLFVSFRCQRVCFRAQRCGKGVWALAVPSSFLIICEHFL